MNISILLPTIWRQERAKACVINILKGMRENDEILIITNPGDLDFFSGIGDPRIVLVGTTIEGYWNCMNSALPMVRNEVILWTADDINPHDGWLEIARAEFEKRFGKSGLGVVAMNDGFVRDATCGHAISTRKFLHVLFGNQGFFPLGFHHLYVDTLIADRAKDLKRFAFCEDAITEHMHHLFGKSERDKLNERNEAWLPTDKATKDAMDKEWRNKERYAAQMRLSA